MRRIGLAVVLALTLALAPLTSDAPQTACGYRGPGDGGSPHMEALSGLLAALRLDVTLARRM